MELFYRKFGEGEPLLIIHGLYGSSDNWITIGRKLGEHFSVYLIDQRNHGNSPHSIEHSYDIMLEDIKEFVDSKGFSKVNILGHSMGGKSAMFFAKKYPCKIRQLIVVDISPLSYSNVKEHEENYQAHLNILKGLQSIDLTKLKSRAQADNILSEYVNSQLVRQFLLKNLKRNDANQFTWKINVPALKNNLHEILRGINETDMDLNDEHEYKTLFIKGEKSNYIKENDVLAIKQQYPNSSIIEIKEAGHWVHFEQTEIFTSTILNFLQTRH